MFDSLLKKLPTRLLAPLISVTGATAVSNLVGFAVSVFAARALGAAAFGLYSLAFSLTTLTTAVAELGLNLATIRLSNKYREDRERLLTLWGSVLRSRMLVITTLALVSVPLGLALARAIGLGTGQGGLLAVGMVTGAVLCFWTYFQSYLQAHRRFGQLTRWILGYAGLRLASLVVCYGALGQSPVAWLVAIHMTPVLLVAVAGLLPRAAPLLEASLRDRRMTSELLREALNYGKWVALSGIVYIAWPTVVRFMLATLASPEQVGVFSAGLTFSAVFSTINTGVRAVMFPQVTALTGLSQVQAYLSRMRKVAPHYIGLATLAITALGMIQWLALGPEYRQALPVFLVTALSSAVTVFLGLLTMLLHTMMVPAVDVWVNLVGLGLTALLTLALVPASGAVGAGIAYSVPLVVGEALKFRYVKHRVERDA